ncbi:MAG: endolytic transglycosylase MltG, partial [Caulobacteraceae bacterium]
MSGERGPRREGRLGLSLAGARAAGAAVVVAIGLLVVGAVCLWILWEPGPAAKSGPATDVILLPGSGLSEIAADLKGAGVIRSGALFMAAAQAGGASRSLKAGEYLIPSGASLARVLAKIRSGEVVRHMVTIPEGATSAEVAAILDGEPYLKGVAPTPPEGSVLPETYAALWGEDRARLLQRMMQARDVLLASLWEHRRAGLPYASPEEAVIIASIVEKETAKPNERPLIAAVFLNRLAKGMRLQSDPTVIYGL